MKLVTSDLAQGRGSSREKLKEKIQIDDRILHSKAHNSQSASSVAANQKHKYSITMKFSLFVLTAIAGTAAAGKPQLSVSISDLGGIFEFPVND